MRIVINAPLLASADLLLNDVFIHYGLIIAIHKRPVASENLELFKDLAELGFCFSEQMDQLEDYGITTADRILGPGIGFVDNARHEVWLQVWIDVADHLQEIALAE